jgi:hypothetical protein
LDFVWQVPEIFTALILQVFQLVDIANLTTSDRKKLQNQKAELGKTRKNVKNGEHSYGRYP